MKKVKIMLLAITVFAIIGGVLAFKAKGNNTFYSINNNPTTGACDLPFWLKSTTTFPNLGVFDPTVTLIQSSPGGAWLKVAL